MKRKFSTAAVLGLTASVALGMVTAAPAQAAPVPGFKGGTVQWYANGDTVTVRDTKADGYAFEVSISVHDTSGSHMRSCDTSGYGQTKTCHFDYPEGKQLEITGLLNGKGAIHWAGTAYVKS
ncbi:hypothetical protein [Streptomyces lydicus]|uniref:hypothetical protein n=1 Tax=Streptomyces lydicus TaxID=47763 RepID=UPI0028707240|nr:hypothetical protein [Streptomyces lydicus]